ncbi:DUF2891 domain-containing protein [Aurantiacibacter sp. D1-12]|uniref:DUF2891 domain-containing protein n=1 Tax=Aurantiacibacter sp. D1-12 TaxID=2993658 RepID=UPI00237CC9B0|nr:DUF2891 domain-containing protein [Aurantiacibacter sp. D1-12]MDE1467549.1 DUF2891 domain-containing protein [Aurantiacibacter sp. D1-12]
MSVDPSMAGRFARTALDHVCQEYPNKLDHVMGGDEDALSPSTLHPVFYGSFDWHSCVHSWWLLLTIRRVYPDLPEAPRITALADEMFTAEKLAVETEYARRPLSRGFERPYGWAWYLNLHLEASREPGKPWAQHMEPLARQFAAGWRDYLAALAYPIRTGTHFNTAFAMRLSLDWAEVFDPALAKLMGDTAMGWFEGHRDVRPIEPSGDDFLSGTLTVAQLMRKVGRVPFADWLDGYLPGLAQGRPACLFDPVVPRDRSDGKMAHLDGFNISRAWAWIEIGKAADLGERENPPEIALYNASIDQIDQDYMSSHWLASFALLTILAYEERHRS